MEIGPEGEAVSSDLVSRVSGQALRSTRRPLPARASLRQLREEPFLSSEQRARDPLPPLPLLVRGLSFSKATPASLVEVNPKP